MWLADSTPVRLRVVAVLADQIDLEQTVLLPSALRAGHTSVPMASTVYLSLSPGAKDADNVRQIIKQLRAQSVKT